MTDQDWHDQYPNPLHALSYGGGVQSTALVVLAARGEVPIDVVVHANVGDDSEDPLTVAYVRDVAVPYADAHGLDLVVQERTRRDGSTETLFGRLTREGSRSIGIPVRMSNGAPGRRACTADFKIKVVRKSAYRPTRPTAPAAARPMPPGNGWRTPCSTWTCPETTASTSSPTPACPNRRNRRAGSARSTRRRTGPR